MATFIRVVDYDSAGAKEKQFHQKENMYFADQSSFSRIPTCPFVYWASSKILKLFDLQKICEIYNPRFGMSCGDGERFIRRWFEVNNQSRDAFDKKKWVPLDKGGEFRKWYGNMTYVINWDNNGKEIKEHPGSAVRNEGSFFKRHLSWTLVGAKIFSARYFPKSFIIDTASNYLCDGSDDIDRVISFLNSNTCQELLMMLNPTLNFSCGVIGNLPVLSQELDKRMISISKADWDQREYSLDFRRSPLITQYHRPPSATSLDEILVDLGWPSWFPECKSIELMKSTEIYMVEWSRLFSELQSKESAINYKIGIYVGINDKSANVPYSEITILQEELSEVARKENRIEFDQAVLARQFISYGVGCLVGRYSVEKDGLILADAGSTIEDFKAKIPDACFFADADGILPLTDEDDFPDDLPTAFKNWLLFISGEHYNDNLRWIEDRLGKDLRSYFDIDYYKEHIRRYKSRPIYWMVSSPSGAFRALIYLHRYTKDSVGKILNDYVRPYRTKLDQKIRGLESVIDSGVSSVAEKTKAKKRLAQLEKYKVEIETWEKEKLYPLALKRVELDLDDGVKINYRKLDGILEPVKQLEAKEED